MDEKRLSLHKSIDSACDKKVESFTVKLLPDGYLLTEVHIKTNPSRSEIQDAIDNTVLYEFGGIEMHQGQCRTMRRNRRIKI